MPSTAPAMFSRPEAALAYALASERILGAGPSFLESNPAVIPIFVTQLFQSLEVSVKHLGIDSGLITEAEARSKQVRSGHGIQELAALVNEKLGADGANPIVQAITFGLSDPSHAQIVQEMLFGAEFERTRESYATRKLGYGEVQAGDFAVVDRLESWIAAVRGCAEHLQISTGIVRRWASTPGKPASFAIWLGQQ